MTRTEMIFLAFALGMDAFSVALGVGLFATGRRQVFRLCWHFGFFQFLMPLLGWQIARMASPRIGLLSAWVGAGLLFLIGIRMILTGWKKDTETEAPAKTDPTKGWSLMGLSLATSMDALGVGFGVGLVQEDLFKVCIIIGVVALALTWLGMRLGRMAGRRLGSLAETVGGVVLILLGLHMLIG